MANKKREEPKHLGRGLASLLGSTTSGGAGAVLKSGLGMLSAKTVLEMLKTKSGLGMLSAKTVLEMLKTKSGLGMLSTKTALGIDISETLISLTLLRKGKNGIELLKTVSGPVPDGVIKDGNIEDAATLAKAIKELKTDNKIREHHAVLSLVANPVVMQILELPKQLPGNIRQFVGNEVKYCVALSGKEIAFDFCGIGSAARAGNNRLFVVATDGERIAEIAEACSQSGLDIEAIEPPLLAYARAFYAKKIAGKFDCNVLMAVLRHGVLTLCVFRKQTVDFVRIKDISKQKAEGDKLCQQLAEQINAIIQFYAVEVPDSPRSWEITVIASGAVRLPDDAEESLRAKVASANLQVRTAEDAFHDTFVGENSGFERPSAVAIGLAMKLLDTEHSNLRINLLPPQLVQARSARKDALITANVAAVVLLLMILAGSALSMMTKKVNENITHIKRTELSVDTYALLEEEELADRQMATLSEGLDRINRNLSLYRDVDWHRLLNDIRRGIPKTARIINLSAEGASGMSLEGLSLSHEGVRLFVEMLNKSEHIDSASLIEAKKDNQTGGLVRYAIKCSLTARKGR